MAYKKEGEIMAVHTMQELKQFQAMPLEVKIAMTKVRIRDWVNYYGQNGVYVSFSGGKDSTVLLHMVREEYPDIPAVFVDTGLEYPEIREFVKTFDNVTWVKPKLTFKQVIEKYGYPFISKEVAECVYGARKYLTQLIADGTILQTDRQYPYEYYDKLCGLGKCANTEKQGGMITSIADYEDLVHTLKERMCNREGGANERLLILLGELPPKTNKTEIIPDKSLYSQEKYKFFLEAPFEISNKCCNVMKKQPAHRYSKETGRVPILATMAAESRLRTQKWLQNGCNGFDMKEPISTPMAFWTEQDVLRYIKEKNIPICSVYGDIVSDDAQDQLKGQMDISDFGLSRDTRRLKTTGCNRTGCMFCGFGCHLEKEGEGRFERMKVTHPQIYDYIMRPKEEGGLNYKKIIDWTNEHGDMNIRY